MICEYTIRFEDDDLVCFLIIDRVNFIELERMGTPCRRDVERCANAINHCQRIAEEDWGGPLPWAFDEDLDASRVCFTGRLAHPVIVGQN